MLRCLPQDINRRHLNKKAGRSRVPADKAALLAAHSFHTIHHPTLSASSVSIRGSKLTRSKQSSGGRCCSGGRGSCQAANSYGSDGTSPSPQHNIPSPSVLFRVHPWLKNTAQLVLVLAEPQSRYNSIRNESHPDLRLRWNFALPVFPRHSCYPVSIRGSKNQALQQNRLGRNLTHPAQIASPG